MAVRAIFWIEKMEIKPQGTGSGRIGSVHLRPATKGPYEKWSQWTPYGSIELGTLNEQAFAWFEERLGKDVALTFDDPTEADLAP